MNRETRSAKGGVRNEDPKAAPRLRVFGYTDVQLAVVFEIVITPQFARHLVTEYVRLEAIVSWEGSERTSPNCSLSTLSLPEALQRRIQERPSSLRSQPALPLREKAAATAPRRPAASRASAASRKRTGRGVPASCKANSAIRTPRSAISNRELLKS